MVMAAPPNPFRCPPGPYERASMIATFMKAHKPKAKLIILDSKDKFSKQGMFTAGWEEYYGYGSDDAMIEWVSKSNGGEVTRVDPKTKEVVTANGQTIKADVVNFIPSQTANTTAKRMGLTDASGWCPVNQETFESTLVPNIHVLGDASVASPMPKSGFSANSQGMVCGAAVAALLAGHQPNANATMGNQCYSLVTPDYGISVAAGYKLEQSKSLKPAVVSSRKTAVLPRKRVRRTVGMPGLPVLCSSRLASFLSHAFRVRKAFSTPASAGFLGVKNVEKPPGLAVFDNGDTSWPGGLFVGDFHRLIELWVLRFLFQPVIGGTLHRAFDGGAFTGAGLPWLVLNFVPGVTDPKAPISH